MNSTSRRFSKALMLGLTLLGSHLHAQTPPGGLPIPSYADFGDPSDRFGNAISADGSWMVATGSFGEAFYVYERVGSAWTRRQRIVPPTLGQSFFRTPLLRGNRLVISRPFDTTASPSGSGTVYVYERPSPAAPFALGATLRPNDPQAGDRFGYGLGLGSVLDAGGSTQILAIGASARDEAALSDQGVVYIFARNGTGSGWSQIQRITQSDATLGNRFGQDLAVATVGAQTLLTVGASFNVASASARGAAYVFRWNTASAQFEQIQKLIEPPATAAVSSRFAFGVAADGPHLLLQSNGPQGYTYQLNLITNTYGAAAPLPLPVLGAAGGLLDAGLGDSALIEARIAVTARSATNLSPLIAGPDFIASYAFSGAWQRQSQLPQTNFGALEGNVTPEIAADTVFLGQPLADASDRSLDQGAIQPFNFAANGVISGTQTRIWHGSGNTPDRLGSKIAIDGDWMAVAAPGADTASGNDAGAVHLFERDTGGVWQLRSTTTGAHTQSLCALAMKGDTLLFGNCNATVSGTANRGKVEVWKRPNPLSGNIVRLCELTPSDPAATFFGSQVSLSATTILVTRIIDYTSGSFSAARYGVDAFVNPSAACTNAQALTAPEAFFSQIISTDQAISGDRLAIAVNPVGAFPLSSASRMEIYERAAGIWSRVQSLPGPAYAGNASIISAAPYMYAPILDNERLAIGVQVPIGTSIDTSAELWQYERNVGSFARTRAINLSSAVNQNTLAFRGNTFMLERGTTAGNSEILIYDFTTGLPTQTLSVSGLSLEDGRLSKIAMTSPSRGLIGWPDLDRGGANNAGLVYTMELSAIRRPNAWSLDPVQSAPLPDLIFSHFFELDP